MGRSFRFLWRHRGHFLPGDPVSGSRTWGFGDPTVQMGTFENEEFGSYTRYTYSAGGGAVVLTVSGKTVILNGKSPESTEALYRELLTRIDR